MTNTIVTFKIKVDGSSIPDEIEVHSIQIDTKVNKISSAQITVLDGSTSKGDFPISSSATFVPGSEITVEAGYDGTDRVIFKGIVTGQTIEIDAGVGSLLVIDCYDKAVEMTVGEKNKIYAQKTDSAIITSIIASYSGLSSNVVATSTVWTEIAQSQNTDWDFIRYRAEANGCVVTIKDGKVSVIRPENITSSVLSVTYGDTLLSFRATLNAINQLGTYDTEAYDESSKKVTTGTARNQYPGPGNLSSKKLSDVLSIKASSLTFLPLQETVLQELSKAQLVKSSLSKIQGTLKIQGSSLVSSGVYITLDGLGSRFNGDHFISSIHHSIKQGNWITEIGIGMGIDWVMPELDRIGSSVNKSEQGIKGSM